MTRAIFEGCRSFGNTLHPNGAPVPGTAVLKLREYKSPDGKSVLPANIMIDACEWAGNHAGLRNLEHVIFCSAVDGLFVSRSSYFGLTSDSVMLFEAQHASATFTNIQVSAFIDGGQSTARNGIEFKERFPGAMSRACNTVLIDGEISGAAGVGILLNIDRLERVRIDSIIKSCGGDGIHVARGSGIDFSGSILDNNRGADIRISNGSGFSMGSGQMFSAVNNHVVVSGAADDVVFGAIRCKNAAGDDVFRTSSGRNMRFGPFVTDRPNRILAAETLRLPLGTDDWIVSGNDPIYSIDEASSAAKGRRISLQFIGRPTIHSGKNLHLARNQPIGIRQPTILNLTSFDGRAFHETSRSTG
jgi:hypothetical protein